MKVVDSSSIGSLTEHLNTESVGYTVLTVYQVITTLLALLGNSTILFLSYRYNAVPVDCVSLVLVEVLAMLHILLALTSLLSASVTLIAQRWVLSTIWCGIQGFVSYICVLTQLYFICLVACYKVYSLKHPLASPGRIRRRFLLILVVVTLSVTFTSIMGEFYYFSPGHLSCCLSHELGSTTTLLLLACIFFLPPLLLIFSLHTYLLVRSALRTGCSTRQRDNTHTMCAVSLLFVICCLPATTVGMYQVVNSVPAWLETLTLELFHITTFANPLLYLALNGGFRRFLRRGHESTRGSAPPAVIPEETTQRTVSTAEQLRAVPTTKPTVSVEEEPKGVFARAYAQAIRKSSVTEADDENFQFYFAA